MYTFFLIAMLLVLDIDQIQGIDCGVNEYYEYHCEQNCEIRCNGYKYHVFDIRLPVCFNDTLTVTGEMGVAERCDCHYENMNGDSVRMCYDYEAVNSLQECQTFCDKHVAMAINGNYVGYYVTDNTDEYNKDTRPYCDNNNRCKCITQPL